MGSEGCSPFSHFWGVFSLLFRFFSLFFVFFSLFFASLRFPSFFCVFFSYSLRRRANDCNLLVNGEFHSDPVCTDPVQNFPKKYIVRFFVMKFSLKFEISDWKNLWKFRVKNFRPVDTASEFFWADFRANFRETFGNFVSIIVSFGKLRSAEG